MKFPLCRLAHVLGIPSAALVLGLAVAPLAPAAVLTLGTPTKFNTAPATPIDLDTGNIDWAYWVSTSASIPSPMAPVNQKSGGSVISSLSAAGTNTTLRGSATAGTDANFSYANGTTTPSGTVSGSSFVFNSKLNDVTQGVSFTLAGDPNVTRTAILYLGGYGDTGQLTLTLNGATTIVDTSQVFDTVTPKKFVAYPVTYRPDNAADVLTVKYLPTAITDTNGNAHVAALAASVSVPEPTSLAAVALLGMAVIFRRQRRRGRDA